MRVADPRSGSRVRRPAATVAVAVTALVTWTMLSDWPAESGVIADGVPLLPEVIAEPIDQARAGWGDADAHVVLWGLAAVAWAVAVRSRRERRWVYGALAAWSLIVEVVQPHVTTLRHLQLADAVAGVAAVMVVAGVDALLGRRPRSSTAGDGQVPRA